MKAFRTITILLAISVFLTAAVNVGIGPWQIGAYQAPSGSFMMTDGITGKWVSAADAADSLGALGADNLFTADLSLSANRSHDLNNFNWVLNSNAVNNLFFTDGNTGEIGIGTDSPLATLQINANQATALNINRASTSGLDFEFGNNNHVWRFAMDGSGTANSENDFRIEDATTSNRTIFHIESGLPATEIGGNEDGFGIRSGGEMFLGWRPEQVDSTDNLLAYSWDDGAFVTVDKSTIGGGGGSGVASGTSFPGSPSNGESFYRTDLLETFQWNSTLSRWLGEKLKIDFGRGGNVTDNAFLRIPQNIVSSNDVGYTFPFDVVLHQIGVDWDSPTSASGNIEFLGSYGTERLSTIAPANDTILNVIHTANNVLRFRRDGAVTLTDVTGWVILLRAEN